MNPAHDPRPLPHTAPADLETAFDPPHLGMPAGFTASARCVDHLGGFVEIFVTVSAGRVADVGFLTSLPGAGLAAASDWCAAVAGKTLSEAAGAAPGRIPAASAGDVARRAARLACRAGIAALRRAARPPDLPGHPGSD